MNTVAHPAMRDREGNSNCDDMTNPIQFLKESRAELTKVVWPSRKETIRITVAVVLLSLAVAIFLGAVDYGLTKLFEKFVNR